MATPAEPSQQVQFGEFALDLRTGELWRDGEKLALRYQSFQILTALLERPGEMVTREELVKRLWASDVFVDFEGSLNKAMKRLREALHDAADQPGFIETLPRRGFRFIKPVTRTQNLPTETSGLVGKKVSHYRVLEVIGGGGMGMVYKGEDLKLGRRVALKFLPEELASDAVALRRFDREAQTASSLNHPNICTIYEIEEYEGQPFIAMELLEGETVRERLAVAEGALPLAALLDIAIQVTAGLKGAHESGIIHRDIKPANIFITVKGVCKILDFGLAKLLELSNVEETAAPAAPTQAAEGSKGQGLGRGIYTSSLSSGGPKATVDQHLTHTGSAMGTAGYMSPEQVRGEKLDARSDIFSFGLVLYEMATGHRAFSGDTAAIVHEAILHRPQVPVRALNSEVPSELEAIINKALAKDREQRYQTATDLDGDLRRFKNDRDSGRAVAPHENGRRWPLWLAGLLAVLLAGLAIAWFGWHRVGSPPELGERQLTANPLEDRVTGGAISPDAKYVAYHDQTGLYLRSIESGETHAIAVPAGLRSRIFGLCWFPNGAKLLAEVASSDGYDIWVITVLGEAEPGLLYRHAGEPAISPDGRMVAFTNYEFGKIQKEVWVGGVNGEAPRKLVEAGEFQNVFSPAWSPDGHGIAYARRWQTAQGSWTSALEIRPASGGPAKTLVSESSLPSPNPFDLGTDASFTEAWSPDWRLVFSVGGGGDSPLQANFSLWEIQVEPRTGEVAGKPQRLSQWSGFALSNLTITQDGKRLSLVKCRSWMDVYLGELGPGGVSMSAPRRLTLDDRGSNLSTWTRDGHAIVFDSQRNGRRQIFRQGLNENIPEMVVSSPGDVYGGGVSPDGSWLLYWESGSRSVAAQASSDSVWLMRRAAGGGSPERVLEWSDKQAGTLYGFHCSWNPKAKYPCVLGVMEGKELAFYSVDPVRGKGTQLGKIKFTEPVRYSGWGVAPDGSRLAVVDQDKDRGGIEVLTLADGTWRETSIETTETLESIAWAPDGKSFFGTSWARGSFNLLHVTNAGKVQPLLRNGRRLGTTIPLPSPDGKHLAFQGQTWNSNVWTIDNF